MIQLGEISKNIHIIGSPDIDLMKSRNLPSLEQAKKRYQIPFNEYALVLYHPVTSEIDNLKNNINQITKAIIKSNHNYVVIYPNNDLGSDLIIKKFKENFTKNDKIRIFPSLRFEHFFNIIKDTNFIIGNSSAGISEAPFYGIPTVNVGSRQNNRSKNQDIINVDNNYNDIIKGISIAKTIKINKNTDFGSGGSAKKFIKVLRSNKIWTVDIQKYFSDID